MKRLHALRTITLLMAGLVLVSCGGHSKEAETQIPETVEAAVIRVSPESSPRLIPVQGMVQPFRQTVLMGRSTGPVVAIHVRAGDQVEEGQALLEIQKDMNEGMLNQALGAKAQAEAALQLARQNRDRFKGLFTRKACSRLELDMVQMQFDQARGAVKQAEGAVSSARSVADESVIRAPFAGVVVDKMVEIGDLAAPGRPLMMVHSSKGSQLWISVRESDARWLHVNQSLDCELDSRPDLGQFKARVREIIPNADPATHTLMARLDLDVNGVLSGIHGRAWIPAEKQSRLWIPEEALFSSGGVHLVNLVDAQGIARSRAVRPGKRLEGRVEITSGLSADSRIVSPLGRPIAEGTPIREIK